jgi:hypothetical protein
MELQDPPPPIPIPPVETILTRLKELHSLRLKILITVTTKITVFCDVTLCILITGDSEEKAASIFGVEDKSINYRRNVRKQLSHSLASHSRGQ